jgi:aldose 1-epimerase
VTPSGRQTHLRFAQQEAVVVEVGGGLRTYDVAGRPVLDGYAEDEMVSAARGQPLIPWPNRLHTGTYTWDGSENVVPVDEPEQDNALHGLTKWLAWSAEPAGDAAVTMRLRLHPQDAYPYLLDLAVHYALGPEGLTVTTTARNAGDVDAPYGLGFHPYLVVGTERVDEALLQVPAGTWLPTGPSQVPLGREPVDGSPYDFRGLRPVGPLHVDYAFTDLQRDDDARATLVLAAPDGRRVELWVDEAFPYLEVFTGDPLPQPDRRRRSLGVEPMTCPPDAFRTGEDVVRLRPGQEHVARWGIRVAG